MKQFSVLDSQQPKEDNNKMPKRLITLLSLYSILAITGFVFKVGVIISILLLVLVIAVIGKQKSSLITLRAIALLQAVVLIILPFSLSQSETSLSVIFQFPSHISFPSEYDIWVVALLCGICALQIWISFTKKVIGWFTVKNNLNLIQ
ncbi:MAG: hypothetical protein HAW66_09425 [Shewanella sp.]|nr:hypothetical protein [Shewanella sp.]